MDSKILPVLFVATFLVLSLSNHGTEGMYLGGIIANNKIGLGFHGNFKFKAAGLNTKINLGSSEEEFLETNKLKEQGNKVEEDISLADTPEVVDGSVESDGGADNSDEVEATNVSREILEGSNERDMDNDSNNLDVGDNDSDENKVSGSLDSNSNPDGNAVSGERVLVFGETTTKADLGDEIIYVGVAQPDSGDDYDVGKNNDLGEGFSTTSNYDYYDGDEDQPIIGFAVQRGGGRPVLDYGYYNFDFDNYANNLI